MYTGQQGQFRRIYRAFPIDAHPDGNKQHLNSGGMILMPPSALEVFSHPGVVLPLQLRLQNDESDEAVCTHCGVLEFTAGKGRVYLPQWMMETLELYAGDAVEIINKTLPRGTMVRLQPQSVDFLGITDPRAVLENAMHMYSALTVGDTISIEYNDKTYRLAVLETQPSPLAISIIETDLGVDLAPPIGYVEPPVSSLFPSIADRQQDCISSIAEDMRRREEDAKERHGVVKISTFKGQGRVLGSSKKLEHSSSSSSSSTSTSTTTSSDALSVRSPSVAEEPGDLHKMLPAGTDNDESLVPLDVPLGTLFFGYPRVPPPGAKLNL
ncbi:ubiquitin fusion degradation protein [Coemansia sp. RSA 1939]|nr:ubiquitin fusion degradation protein [Coemansia sp. RSA 1939]KAJ2613537.1 ubiquitin fusion degradation protein [Coemansia sp. RSA 1804]